MMGGIWVESQAGTVYLLFHVIVQSSPTQLDTPKVEFIQEIPRLAEQLPYGFCYGRQSGEPAGCPADFGAVQERMRSAMD